MARKYLDHAEVCKKYAEFGSATAAGKHFGVSKLPILRILRLCGIECTPTNVIPERQLKEAETVKLYRDGYTIPEIMKRTGVGRNSTSRFLKNARISVRSTLDYQNGWCRKAAIDEAEMSRLYFEGWTITRLAKRYSVGFGTIQRRLLKTGTELRVVSSVPTYSHNSPYAGRIRVRGSWELMYARVLDTWVQEGKIARWTYESEKIRMTIDGKSLVYIPDFVLIAKDGTKAFHEVKGILRPISLLKVEAAREAGNNVVLLRKPVLYPIFRHYEMMS